MLLLSLKNKIPQLSNQCFSTRWTSKIDAIEIKDYKYENFKEMLSFIYSGDCSLTDANIVVMLDMAEYYQIKHLKELCDQYLAKIQCNLGNVFELIELSQKYSMVEMKKSIQAFVAQNFDAFVNSDELREAGKDVIQELIDFESYVVSREKVFQAVYVWAEHQGTIKQADSKTENLNRNDAIKAALSDFLPYIQFKKMKQDFLIEYVVKRGFIFSYDELSDILANAHPDIKVKITNSHGQSLSGILSTDSNVIKFIEPLKNLLSDNTGIYGRIYWNTKQYLPTTPPSLEKKDGVKWYFIYFQTGGIGVVRSSDIHHTHYLLAEMIPEASGFQVTPGCKIEFE